MHLKRYMAIAAIVLGLGAVAVMQVLAATDKGIPADARQQFDRHNYREALRQLDDYLKAQPEGPAVVDVQVGRGQASSGGAFREALGTGEATRSPPATG